jgi:hypothetical protein
MAKRKDINFKTVEKADGSLGYYVGNTELQDKAAYDRLQKQADQAADQDLADEETKFDTATSSGASSELDSMFKKAKGGKVSSASSRADGCATKGKTKGRFV